MGIGLVISRRTGCLEGLVHSGTLKIRKAQVDDIKNKMGPMEPISNYSLPKF